AKKPGIALVDLFETGNGRSGIDECFGRERWWSFEEHCGTPVASRRIGCRAETHSGSANITTIESRSRRVWSRARRYPSSLTQDPTQNANCCATLGLQSRR